MSNTYLIIIAALIFVGLGIFVLGFLFGFAIKSSHRYRVRTSQNHGETSVHMVIVANFPPPQYHFLNNLTIPIQDGTTQIDHILISTKGIFVIETKNYSGWIFGDEKSKQWVQVIYRVKSKFQNPIHQNFLHVKAIEKLFDFLPKEQIHSIVVFTGTGQFKTQLPKGVVYLYQLVDVLKSFQEDIISTNRVEFCVGRLECKRYEVTKMTDIQHRSYLSQKFGKSVG
jgi:restriction system protein